MTESDEEVDVEPEHEEEPEQQQPVNSVSSDSDGENVINIGDLNSEDQDFMISAEEAKALDENIEIVNPEVAVNDDEEVFHSAHSSDIQSREF